MHVQPENVDDAHEEATALRDEARVEPLAERAYVALEELIVTGRFPAGSLVNEQALVGEIGLGRTPVREALQRLSGEGLLTILPRRGIKVADADPRQQLLVLEVRRELERLLSRTAAERASGEQRRRFSAIAAGMAAAARTSDDRAFLRLDRDLNGLLVEAAHNPFAARSMRILQGHSRRFWYMHYKIAADLPLCARLHAEQALAIAASDSLAAATASDRLLDYTEAFTTRAADATATGR